MNISKNIVSVIVVLCFVLFGCSEIEENPENVYTNLLWSDNYEYAMYYEHKLNDSLRYDRYIIYHVNEEKQNAILKWSQIWDSVLVNNVDLSMNPKLKSYLDSSDVADFSSNKFNLLRDIEMKYNIKDKFFDTLFTEQSFI